MTFPTIEAAATFLGAHQSALVHQFRRLERDIGAKLYRPSAPGQPMRPAPRGVELLKGLNRPDIRALAAQAPGSGPAGVAASSREHLGADSAAGRHRDDESHVSVRSGPSGLPVFRAACPGMWQGKCRVSRRALRGGSRPPGRSAGIARFRH